MTKKNLSAEESALFRAFIGDVKTIDSNTLVLTSPDKPKPYPKQKQVEVKVASTRVPDEIDLLLHEDSMSFLALGIQKKVLKKLRKNGFGFEGSMDLHGLTSREAQQQLSHFLHHCLEEGYRCVHIVHGKGYHSSHNTPVLKNDINVYLRQYKEVQAFCSAPAKLGGTGAVLVLLKLSRKYGEQDDPEY